MRYCLNSCPARSMSLPSSSKPLNYRLSFVIVAPSNVSAIASRRCMSCSLLRYGSIFRCISVMSCSVIVVSPFEVRERHSVAVPFVKLSPLVRVIDDDYGIIASLIPCISVTLAPRKLRFFLLPASA